MTPAPKDLQQVPDHLRVFYTVADAVRTLTLADRHARRVARELVDAELRAEHGQAA
jgi:hypothetical protein